MTLQIPLSQTTTAVRGVALFIIDWIQHHRDIYLLNICYRFPVHGLRSYKLHNTQFDTLVLHFRSTQHTTFELVTFLRFREKL